MAAKKTAKKVVKKAAKKAAKPDAKTSEKPAAKKATRRATAKKVAKKAAAANPTPTARPSHDAIARAAYLNYRRRVEQGLPGDTRGDWLEAERQLGIGGRSV